VSQKLKLGIPKGSLQEATIGLFRRSGWSINVNGRSYCPEINDELIECAICRAQEMSRYVQDGALDCGITGNDWILENGSDVVRVSDLMYAKQTLNKVRWVLAVPEAAGITSPKQLEGKRVATELVNVTKEYFRKHKVNVRIEFSWGATEVKVNAGLVDAIVDITETGRSLRANKLAIIDTLCESTTQFIANKESSKDPWKRDKMAEIALLLKGAIAAEEKVGLKMNAREKDIKKVTALLPALQNPTVSPLAGKGWFAIETIIDEKVVRTLIPALKKAGAEGIIEYPLNKLIY
jgi:ATP phosphoribosyltransferase